MDGKKGKASGHVGIGFSCRELAGMGYDRPGVGADLAVVVKGPYRGQLELGEVGDDRQ